MDIATPKPTESTDEQIVQYYDEIAERYDRDRFANSYGRYVDSQERRLLKRWLPPDRTGAILDLGCGTGRFLDQATHGLDASQAMVRIARQKHPGKEIRCGLAWDLAEFGNQFSAIFCLHLFMHLSPAHIERIICACSHAMRPGGLLIIDIASARRRTLTGFRPPNWHAGTALRIHDVRAMTRSNWRVKAVRGILFFPLHRLPAQARRVFRPFDDFVGITPLKEFSSYLFFCLERKG